MADVAIRCEGVSFRYGRRWALRGVELGFGRGVTGLLGPNGAGKSTLVALLATLTVPREGQVHVLGHDTSRRDQRLAVRRRLGVLPQRFSLVGSMKVLDTVAYAAWMHGVHSRDCRAHARRALEDVDLGSLARRRVRSLSGGQRQRVGIAAAVAHEPDVLVLDEPTAGLDPAVRVQVRRNLHRIAAERVVVLSTHLVEDVVHLCRHVSVLAHGRVAYDGPTSRLADSVPANLGGDPLASPLELAYERLLHAPADAVES